jgi:hypothetical protein
MVLRKHQYEKQADGWWPSQLIAETQQMKGRTLQGSHFVLISTAALNLSQIGVLAQKQLCPQQDYLQWWY